MQNQTNIVKRSNIIVVLLNLFLSFSGMLYIGRGVRAVFYMLSMYVIYFLSLRIDFGLDRSQLDIIIYYGINIIAAIDALLIINTNVLVRKWYMGWHVITISVALFSTLYCLKLFVCQSYITHNHDMSPTVDDSDYTIAIKPFLYNLLQFSGIVENSIKNKVITYKLHDEVIYVSRIIATANDVREVKEGKVYVNHQYKFDCKYCKVPSKFDSPNLEIVPSNHSIVAFDAHPQYNHLFLVDNKKIEGYVKAVIFDKKYNFIYKRV